MSIVDYLRGIRRMWHNRKYLIEEELLFRSYEDIMLKERSPLDDNIKGKKILVVSKFFTRNFGDRVGFHNVALLTSLVDDVAYVDFDDLERLEKDPSKYDLLIVGTGNSLYKKTNTSEFIEYLSKAKKSIGIFGLQYFDDLQENISTLKTIVESFDKVFIRYSQDIDFLQDNNINTEHISHLGDWLILLFPITSWSKDETKYIDHKEPFVRNALDLYIQDIQTYRNVESKRLHTLLCALCSAENVSYGEQNDLKNHMISGKFQGLLTDIFNKKIEANHFFKVDKQSVINYKQYVGKNFQVMINSVNQILNENKSNEKNS